MQDIDVIQEITLLGIFPTTLCYYYLSICPSLFFLFFPSTQTFVLMYVCNPLPIFFPLLPAMIIFELLKTMFQKSGQKFNSKKKGRVWMLMVKHVYAGYFQIWRLRVI